MSEQTPKPEIWSGEVLSCGCGISPEGAPGAYGCSAGCMEPVPSVVSTPAPSTPDTALRPEIRAEVRATLATTQTRPDDFDALATEVTDAVLAVVQPDRDRLRAELDLQGEQITRLHEKLRALVVEQNSKITARDAAIARLDAEVDRLRAENDRLRGYTETTRYHQQRHAEAVRELEKLRQFAAGVDTALVPVRDLNSDIPVLDPAILDEMPDLRDRVGRTWHPTGDNQYVLYDPDDPDNPGWLRPDIDRLFGPLTEVPAERGDGA